MNPAMCRVCASMLAVAGSAAATALAVGTTAPAASAVDQLISTGSINIGSAFEAAGIAALTGGLTQGLLGNTGIGDLGNGITDASSSTTLANLGATAENVVGQSLIAAGATNLIEGGSFGSELLASFGQYAAAVGANGIGNVVQEPDSVLAVGSVGYDLAHAALGCAAGAASGQGCGGGAIGGAASAILTPLTLGAIDPDHDPLTTGQTAFATAVSMLFGGTVAGLLGQNSSAAAMSAANEALNNAAQDWEKEEQVNEHTFTHNIVPQSGGAIDEEEAGSTGEDLTVGKGTPVLPGASATNNAPLGLGSTGRTIANSLNEQLAMKQVMSDPAAGTVLPLNIGDSRWPATDGWVKMAQSVNGVEIHYVRNTNTGAVDDFKFK